MQVAFLVYEGLTALDLVGPYEVLNAVPGSEIRFVAKHKGELRVDSGVTATGFAFLDATPASLVSRTRFQAIRAASAHVSRTPARTSFH